MRRRGFVKTLAAIPAAPALLAQQPAAVPAPGTPVRPPTDELPAMTPSIPDAAGEMMPRYFSPSQFAALRKVSDLLMPAMNGAAGALDAKAPEFLDFLISQSPADRQQLYKAGLDALNQQSAKQYSKPFADLDATQADTFLAALRKPWTFDEPSDEIAAFLRAA